MCWAPTASEAGLSPCINRGFGHVPVNPFSLLVDLAQRTVSLNEGLCRIVSGSTPITDLNIQGFGKYVALNEVIGDLAFYLLTTSIVILIGVATVQMIRGNAEHRKSIILAITVTMIFTVISAIVLEPLDLLVRVVQFRSVSNITIYWYEPLLSCVAGTGCCGDHRSLISSEMANISR